jgi:hypothetical protein
METIQGLKAARGGYIFLKPGTGERWMRGTDELSVELEARYGTELYKRKPGSLPSTLDP